MVSIAQDLQCVSPQALDPAVQILVQDQLFISAVRDGALHSAAIAAVRLLKPHLSPADVKRAADRRTVFSEGDVVEGCTLRHVATSPAAVAAPLSVVPLPRPVLCDPRLRELVRSIRQEALQIEDLVPWTSVRRTWRNRRTAWRRQVKTGEAVPDLALRLKELRAALLTDEPGCFGGCGQAWRVQLDACIQGRGSHHALASVWEELKGSIKAWLDIRDRPADGPSSAAALHLGASAVRAVRAMADAAAATTAGSAESSGGTGDGDTYQPWGCDEDSAMLQVPLESILNYSREGLASVQQAIDFERRVALAAQQQQQPDAGAGGGAGEAGPPVMASYFKSLHSGWDDSEFGSYPTGEPDHGSDATDLDSDFD